MHHHIISERCEHAIKKAVHDNLSDRGYTSILHYVLEGGGIDSDCMNRLVSDVDIEKVRREMVLLPNDNFSREKQTSLLTDVTKHCQRAYKEWRLACYKDVEAYTRVIKARDAFYEKCKSLPSFKSVASIPRRRCLSGNAHVFCCCGGFSIISHRNKCKKLPEYWKFYKAVIEKVKADSQRPEFITYKVLDVWSQIEHSDAMRLWDNEREDDESEDDESEDENDV